MSTHPQRELAIRRCLDQGERPASVAAELGVAASTLRGWLRRARLEREVTALRVECEAQRHRQRQIEQELLLAAEQLDVLRQLLDPAGGKAAG